jgi:cysteine synthase
MRGMHLAPAGAGISGLIGNTPLLGLAVAEGAGTVLLKMEQYNPTGSANELVHVFAYAAAEELTLRVDATEIPAGNAIATSRSSGNSSASRSVSARHNACRMNAATCLPIEHAGLERSSRRGGELVP